MGLFDDLFGKNDNLKNNSSLNWNYLEETDLNQIDETSFKKPVVLFKHSTRCIISKMALKEFEKQHSISSDKMDLYLLDLLNHRHISNEIAERYAVTHQSPQILVISEGKCIYHNSHDGINANHLKAFV